MILFYLLITLAPCALSRPVFPCVVRHAPCAVRRLFLTVRLRANSVDSVVKKRLRAEGRGLKG